MSAHADFDAMARRVIDANLYMTLGTVDDDGRPRVTPVFFATADHREFLWVSDPASIHSRNLEARPQIAIVIFDPGIPLETEGYGVYVAATADRPSGAERDRMLLALTARSEAHGGRRWTPDRVEPPARMRLYRATAHALDVWPDVGTWDD